MARVRRGLATRVKENDKRGRPIGVVGFENLGCGQKPLISLTAWLHGRRVQARKVGLEHELVQPFALPRDSVNDDAATK